MRYVLKVHLVLRVCLDAQRGCEDELTDCCAEAGKKSVEGKVSNQDYIEELQSTDDNEKRKEGIEELCSLGCLGDVFIPYSLRNGCCVCVVCFGFG